MAVTTILYAWSDRARPQYIKFGDHTEPDTLSWKEAEENTKKYIRGTLSRQKYLFDAKEVVVHWVIDATAYAQTLGKNYPHAKLDDYIRKTSSLRLYHIQDDIYDIDLAHLTRAVNDKLLGSSNLNSYSTHTYQQAAIDKAAGYFTASKYNQDFLLDCVMRFGKSFTSYQIAKKLNAKRILVLTGRPKVKDGWRDDLDHVDFDGWEFIDSQLTDDVRFSNRIANGEAEVIFASFQGGKRDDSRIEQVIDQKIDLVIVDEAHSYFSQDAIDFTYQLNAKHRLWVSGTPFKAYESGMFDGETDTYRFTLVDLMRAKRQVEEADAAGTQIDEGLRRFTDFPDIQFLVADYPDYSVSTNSSKILGEQGLNMRSLLSNNHGVANYPVEVRALLDTLLGSGGALQPPTRGKNAVKYPVTAKHIWMTVPAGTDDSKQISVASAVTLADQITAHDALGKRYAPLAIRGDKVQDDVNRHITLSDRNGTGTVNISCRSLNTGTKFPELDTVVFLSETSSASEFWQTVGRVLQPGPNKKSVTVICYSIEMAVTMVNKMVEYSAQANVGHQQMVTEFLNMMPVFSLSPKIGVRALDVVDVYKELSTRGSVTKAFSDREVLSKNIDQIIANNLSFFSSIPDMNSTTEPNSKAVMSSGTRGKNAIQTRQGKPAGKTQDLVKITRERVREFLTYIGSVMAASAVYDDHVITNSNELLAADPEVVNNELYSGTMDIINELYDLGALNATVLDRKIGAFYEVELRDKV